MATRVPLPKFHNHTPAKFSRKVTMASDFDPFFQPPEPKSPWWNRVLYWTAVIMLVSMALAMAFYPGEL
jgi:hypothetical protein